MIRLKGTIMGKVENMNSPRNGTKRKGKNEECEGIKMGDY